MLNVEKRHSGMMSVTEDTGMILTRHGENPGPTPEGWVATGEILGFQISGNRFDGHMFERLLAPPPDVIVKVDL